MSNDFPQWLLGGIAILLLLIGGFWFFWVTRTTRGRIRRMLRQLGGVYLKDVLVPDGLGGEIQIDYLLRLPDRILVIDLKEMQGVLFGAEKIDEWTQIVERRSYRFPNPLHGNRMRCQAVAELVKPAEVIGRVVFTDASEFPRGRPEGVSTLASLTADLDAMVSEPVVPAIATSWSELTQLARPVPQH